MMTMKHYRPLAGLLGGAIMIATAVQSTQAKPRATHAPAVQPVSAAGLRQQIAAQKGKVVLVNFWATWCPGCVKEFPDLVKLQRAYAGRGLKVLFVSADDKGDVEKKVRPFLAKHGVTATSYLINGDPNQFVAGFDPGRKSAFALPRTFLYNKQGKRVKEIEMVDFAGAEKAVKPLL